MTTLVSETPEVEEHYVTQAAITLALFQAMEDLWPSVPTLDLLEQYREAIASLIPDFQMASIASAFDHYADMRDRAGVVEPYRPSVIAEWSPARVDAYIKEATGDRVRELEAFTTQRAAEVDAEKLAAIHEQIRRDTEGVAQELVQGSGRDQIVAAVEGDEKALGFVRVASPGACAWCITQAIRKTRAKNGKPARYGVYKSRASAGQIPANEKGDTNRFHPNCNCQVEPVFADDYTLEPGLVELEKLYSDSTKDSKPKQSLNDFRRALAAKRRGEEPAEPDEPQSTSAQPTQAEQLAALLARLP